MRETGRSLPDIGNAVKLGRIYDKSLDSLFGDGDIVRQFEVFTEKRRKFWQMMLEIGVILELLSMLLPAMEFHFVGQVLAWGGALLVTLAIVMHLYVFDHSTNQVLRGLLGITIHWTLLLGSLLFPGAVEDRSVTAVYAIAAGLVYSAGVWTIDWKSTRLWLMIALLVGTPLFLMGKGMQDAGMLVEQSPFPGQYRVEEVLYPENADQFSNAVVELGDNSLFLSMDGIDRDYIGIFAYCAPNLEDTAHGIWLLTPKDSQTEQFRLVLQPDGSLQLAYNQDGQMQWHWELKPDHRRASITVSTFGHTTFKGLTWYPGNTKAQDPAPSFANTIDVVLNAKLNLNVNGMAGESLALYEEYHYGQKVDYEVYSLQPKKNGSFSMPLKVRYKDVKEQYAVYRIPFEDGEYRFTLTYAGLS